MVAAQIDTHSIGYPLTVDLRKNGITIGSTTFSSAGGQQVQQIVWTGEVAAGDLIYLVLPVGGGSWGGVINPTTTWIAVHPLEIKRQRMIKSGTSTTIQNPLQGWVTNDNDAFAVIDTHKLRVLGAGPAEILWNVGIASATASTRRTQQLWHNSTLIDEFIPDQNVTTVYERGPFPINVVPNDLVYMVTAGSSFAGGGTVQATTTFIEVRPRS
ncbi:hypothetical protein SEA_LILYPAD_30 [Gordonia phage LilyPad]|nr:hypothetical protein SEA_LILYPAD_30 [Gordonia phage LilyPad]